MEGTRHNLNHAPRYIEVINEAVERGAPYQARNLLGHARALFNWAIEAGDYG